MLSTFISPIGSFNFTQPLCDLGTSINLMKLAVFKQLMLEAPILTTIELVIADRIVKKQVGILYNVLVTVASLIIPTDFLILDYEVDFQVPIILGRPFLFIGRTLIDLEIGHLILRLNNEQVIVNVFKYTK